MASSIVRAIRGTIPKGAGAKVQVGQWAEWSRTLTQAEVDKFIDVSGDDNPVHYDSQFAATTMFKRPIVHGMLYGSMFATIFGATIPGSIYVSQSFAFRRPVYIGDTVTARLEVLEVTGDPARVTCSTMLSNEKGVCLRGESVVMLLPLSEESVSEAAAAAERRQQCK